MWLCWLGGGSNDIMAKVQKVNYFTNNRELKLGIKTGFLNCPGDKEESRPAGEARLELPPGHHLQVHQVRGYHLQVYKLKSDIQVHQLR